MTGLRPRIFQSAFRAIRKIQYYFGELDQLDDLTDHLRFYIGGGDDQTLW